MAQAIIVSGVKSGGLGKIEKSAGDSAAMNIPGLRHALKFSNAEGSNFALRSRVNGRDLTTITTTNFVDLSVAANTNFAGAKTLNATGRNWGYQLKDDIPASYTIVVCASLNGPAASEIVAGIGGPSNMMATIRRSSNGTFSFSPDYAGVPNGVNTVPALTENRPYVFVGDWNGATKVASLAIDSLASPVTATLSAAVPNYTDGYWGVGDFYPATTISAIGSFADMYIYDHSVMSDEGEKASLAELIAALRTQYGT